MPNITFLRPIDQPTGNLRLLDQLEQCLSSPEYNSFRLAVAFAKAGPLQRLAAVLKAWRAAGKTIEGIFGIDHLGTSRQALEFALEHFDKAYISNVGRGNVQRVTFHPKFYLFTGDTKAICFYGSHNLTVGGTETNFEGGIRVEFELPVDATSLTNALDCWISLLPPSCPITRELDSSLLNDLARRGWLHDESQSASQRNPRAVGGIILRPGETPLFGSLRVKPPRPAPRPVDQRPRAPRTPSAPAGRRLVPILTTLSSKTLVIEIAPHNNGEILLSTTAVKQNPEFFGEFNGRTQPKKSGNLPYYQRIPDPIVNIKIYDASGVINYQNPQFSLNMIRYIRKSEVRITVSPDIRNTIQSTPPDYAVMVMSLSQPDDNYDYDIAVFNPGSAQYDDYKFACNQQLPSGGKEPARRMGWLWHKKAVANSINVSF